MQCQKIVTHLRPHLDEIVAIWLLRKFGKQKYPGANSAEIEFWDKAETAPDGKNFEEYEDKGHVFIGIGGGEFDEHPDHTNGSERSDGNCAATLVARKLGIDQEPFFSKILKFVADSDLKGSSHPFDLSAVVNNLNAQFPNDPYKVIGWAIMGIEAKYREQFQFFQEAKKEFEQKAKIDYVQNDKKSLPVAIIESDEEQVARFARSSFAINAAVVVQKRSTGNVQIFTNKKYGLKITDVAQMVRLEEQRLKKNLVTIDWKELGSEGKVEGAEEWFFHQEGQMLLNGSLSAPKVPSTRIPLEVIRNFVIMGISNSLPEHCSGNRQCIFKKCGWYHFGLHRCRKIRYEMKTNQ